MTKTAIHSNDAPRAIGPYSQAIATDGLVFCSGQIPLDPSTNQMVGQNNIADQTKQVLMNLDAVLREAGSSLENVIKATIYLTNLDNFKIVNEVYGTFFKEPYPARATIEVSALPMDASVEIEVVAKVL